MDQKVGLNLAQDFRGKKIFLTGDTGFKGSWLALWLSEMGADVTGFALPPEHPNDHFHLLKLDKRIHHIDGDIRDSEALKKAFKVQKHEIVLHLAAQPLVRKSYRDPKYTFDTNVGGSVNVLELVRESDCVRSLIFVTSDKSYKNKEWIWGYRETDELGGRDPYSASKSAADVVFSSYYDSFLAKQGIGAASVRAGNVIGGGDWSEDRIVPDLVKSFLKNEPAVIRNPIAVRPWQHVLEPLSGYLLLASKLVQEPKKFSGAWNFGPSNESVRTVRELSKEFIKNFGKGTVDEKIDPNAPHEATLLQLNCDKANQLLKWYPRWNFETCIAQTARWYKETTNGSSALELSTNQIKQYSEV